MRDWLDRHSTDDEANGSTCHTRPGLNALPSGVTKLQEGGTDSPLYFIGTGLPAFRIAQLMGPGHAIFGVEAVWPSAWRDAAVYHKTSALPTMEQLLVPDVAQLRAHLRSPPRCALVGYSFGGVMAFEAAHQLLAQGVRVEMVMLLDAEATYRSPHEVVWQNLQKDWKRTMSQPIGARLQSSWSIIRWMLIRQTRRLGRRLQQVLLRDLDEVTGRCDETGKPLLWGLLERIYLNAAQSYQLHPLDCRGVLFRAGELSETATRALDGSLGWNNLFGRGLEIIDVPGNHATALLRDQYNCILAQEMKKVLDRDFASEKSVFDSAKIS